MSGDPFGQSGGSAESFIARIQSATTLEAKAEALGAYEAFVGGGGQSPASSSPLNAAPVANPVEAIRDAQRRALEAPTAWGRREAVNELERLQIQEAAQASTAEPTLEEGDAPNTPADYQLAAPGDVEVVVDEQARAQLAIDLHQAGVPVGVANMAFQQAARLFAQGVTATPETYHEALVRCGGALEKALGVDEAGAVARDGVAYLENLAARNPGLRDAAKILRADPWAISTAANLQRSKGGR